MTTTYQIWLSYTHPGVDVSLTAMVTGGDQLYNARVVFKYCPPPNPCSTPLVMSRSIMSVESFFLTSGENWNVDLTLTDIDLNIVRISFTFHFLMICFFLVYRITFWLFPWRFMKPQQLKRATGFWIAAISLVDHWGGCY